MMENGSPILLKNTAGTLTIRNAADDTDLVLVATPAVHTHVPEDVTGTAIVDGDSRLDDARTPTIHTNSVHSGATANQLTGLTPTFTNWTTDPGTAANLINELTNDILTTPGVSKGTPGSQIDYDLTTSKRRIVYVNANTLLFTCWISDDGNTWYQNTGDAGYDSMFMGKFRHLRIQAIGVATISYIKIRCYDIN